jgi:hypothetical protein
MKSPDVWRTVAGHRSTPLPATPSEGRLPDPTPRTIRTNYPERSEGGASQLHKNSPIFRNCRRTRWKLNRSAQEGKWLWPVTTHVSAWFGRDERPPTSGVSPIFADRTHVRGWRFPVRTTVSRPCHVVAITEESPTFPIARFHLGTPILVAPASSGARSGHSTGLDVHPALWQNPRARPFAHQSTFADCDSRPAQITADDARRPIQRHSAPGW